MQNQDGELIKWNKERLLIGGALAGHTVDILEAGQRMFLR